MRVVVPEHPLRISEVMRRGGIAPLPREEQLLVTCPSCERQQSLAEASLEPAIDPDDITAYRCINGCQVIAGTGHPTIPKPGSGRCWLGEYVFWTANAVKIDGWMCDRSRGRSRPTAKSRRDRRR